MRTKLSAIIVALVISASPTIAAPNPPTLSAPGTGSTISVGQNVNFSWNTSTGAARYRLKTATNAAMSTGVAVYDTIPLGQTSWTVSSSAFSAGQTYYWQVGAIAAGDVGGWGVYGPSPAWSFTIAAPSPPTLVSPSSGSNEPPGQSVTFSWNASTGAARYRLKTATNAAMSTGVAVYDTIPLGQTSWTVSSSAFSAGQTYYWQVGAIAAGDVGGWGVYGPSPAWSFTIAAPSPPTLVSPSSGSNEPPGQSVTFSWNASTGAARYRLKTATNAAMSTGVAVYDTIPLGQTSWTVSSGAFSAGQTYYWQVGAIAAGDVGGWGVYGPSPAWSFTIAAPSPPTLVSPSSGSNEPPGQSVTFSWNTSTGAARYRLKTATDPAMSTGVAVYDTIPLGQTSWTVSSSAFSAGQTYYWQVGAIAAGDVGGWGVYGPSPAWSFTIAAPSPPTLVSPSSGSNEPPGQSVTFSWNTSTGAARYRLKTATDPAMSTGVAVYDTIPLGQTSWTVSSSAFSAGQTYYWQVGAIAAGDVGGWGVYGPSPAWSFTIAAPSPPTLVSPSSGSNEPPGQSVTFSWNTSTGAARYRLKTATDPAMSTGVAVYDTIPLGQTSWTVSSSAFSAGQTYYWQVGAIAAGDVGGWGVYGPSPAWSFTIAAPSPPTLVSPSSGSNEPPGQSVTFSWNTSTGAARYRLKTATDPAMNTGVVVYDAIPLGQTSWTVSSSAFSAGQTYYWQVGAIAAGDVGGWGVYGPSPAWSFVVVTVGCGNGVVNPGEACDQGSANGTSASCCTSSCTLRASGSVCRPAAGVCDVPETCSGSSPVCPADDKVSNGTTCRVSTGIGDPAEVCDGAGSSCPPDLRCSNLDQDQDGYTTCQGDCDDGDRLKDPRPGHGCDSANYGHSSKSAVVGDPVNAAIGNFVLAETDLDLAGPGINLVFSRTYNSKDASAGPFGHGWTHSFNIGLAINADGTRTLRGEDGHTEIFTTDGAGGFTDQYGFSNRLVLNGDASYSFVRKADHARMDFDSTGKLMGVVDKNGNAITCSYTGAFVTTLTDAAHRAVALGYDNLQRLTTLTDPIGRTIEYGYDASGNLASVRDPRGNSTQYGYDVAGRLATIRDRRGNVVSAMVYDAEGRVGIQQDAYGLGTNFAYDQINGKTDVTDPLGKTTSFWFDEAGRTTRVRDSLGRELSYTYDAGGNRTAMTDKAGATTHFSYDARGNVLVRLDPDGAVTTFTYDTDDHVLQRTDPLGYAETFAFDASGNQVTWVDRTAHSESRAYTANGQLQALTDRRGKSTVYAYDAQGNLVSTTDALSKMTTYTYDGVGRKLTATDPNLNSATFTYDPADHLIHVQNALNQSTLYGFDENGNPTTVTDANGLVTTKVYDAKNRLIQVVDPLGHTVGYGYDADDRRVSETDARGNTTTVVYDDVGNLISVTDPLLHTTNNTYDAAGRRLTSTDADSVVTRWTYDVMGRVLTVQDGLLNTTTTTYDPRGDEATVTDPRGKVTSYARDGEQRLTSIVDALLGQSMFTFDEEGHRKTLENANSHVTSYTYDDVGRLGSITDPLGNVTQYGYDAGGRKISRTDASNRTTQYAYDAANRLTTTTYPDSTTATLGYDAVGRRTSMADGSGTTTFIYDAAGRATSVTDGAGRILAYTFDNANNRMTMTLPGPLTMAYTYDADNRLTTITDWAPGNGTATYAYTAAGRIASLTNPNGTLETLQYDAAGRLSRQTVAGSAGMIVDYGITLDAAGNRTAVDRTQPTNGTLADAAETYSYDIGERILSRGSGVYGHDANANMTSRMDERGTNTFAYDFDDRMNLIAGGALNDLYSYDAEGNRVRADRGGKVTQYLLDHTAPMIEAVAEYDGFGNPVQYHVQGHGLLWSVDSSGARAIYHADPLGSVTAVTNDAQSLTAAFDYDEFGEVTASSGPFSTDACFVGSQGVTREPAGLYFMRARHYDATLGRFLARDPVEPAGNGQQFGGYSYASNSPVLLIDPLGTTASNSDHSMGAAILWVESQHQQHTLSEAEFRKRLAGFRVQRALSESKDHFAEADYYNAKAQIWKDFLLGVVTAPLGGWFGAGTSSTRLYGDIVGSDPSNATGQLASSVLHIGADAADLAAGAKTAVDLVYNTSLLARISQGTGWLSQQVFNQGTYRLWSDASKELAGHVIDAWSGTGEGR